MKMKTLIRCPLLIVCVWTRLQLLVAQYTGSAYPVWPVCGDTKYNNGSDFQRNLNQVLKSLVGNASVSGFNTRVEGQNKNSTVYGLVQCRGDLNSSDCKGWASEANKSLLQSCHSTSGFIQVDSCFLRYDNHNFYNDYSESSDSTTICNNIPSKVLGFENTTKEVLSKLIEKTVQSHTLFATDKFETDYPDVPEIYSLAQCWNLSQTNCRSCLAHGRSMISGPVSTCITGAFGGRYLSTNCFLRYETRSFFNTSIIPSPPPPPPPPPPQPPAESPPVSGMFFNNDN
jgi:hypothetical protein